jgi:hypothetical protein
MLKRSSAILCALTLSTSFAGVVYADDGNSGRAYQGVISCGFNNRARLGGTEMLQSFVTLRNDDTSESVVIKRMTFYDAQGTVLYDSDNSGLPVSTSGIWGPGNNVLAPHQSAQWDVGVAVPLLGSAQRPGQLVIRWSSASDNKVLIPGSSSSRVSRQRDPGTGAVFGELARSSLQCRSIPSK